MSEKTKMTIEERKKYRRLSQRLYAENNPKYDAGQKVNNIKRKIKKLKAKMVASRVSKKKDLQKKLLVAEAHTKELYERLIESMSADNFMEMDYVTISKLALNDLNTYALKNFGENITQEAIFKGIYNELASLIITNNYIPNERLATVFYNLVFQDNKVIFPVLDSIDQQAVERLLQSCKKNLELANDVRAMIYAFMDQ
ncbi:hypothetical protein K501DRAFT_328455 [Backusella circina FSU 941]|nr:hypothetical protein K501DRAFT_328455 [Backusella circina FSU 941]